jgi:protein involved in polysaccharide export with SLBB domain
MSVPVLMSPQTSQPGQQTYDTNTAVTVPQPSRRLVPLRTRSDFEKLAEDEAGRRVPVYGRQLFDEVPTTFAPLDRVPVPADYAIGPGDELLIRVWGKIDLDSRVTVDRNGQINLPKIGTLNVAGLRYQQLEGYLRSAIGALYKDFELSASLGRLRSIQVFVLGSARQPGAYTVSSLSTLVNALFASGGPSATGTMRHIQLRRGDRVLAELDLYDLLQKGDKSHDIPLLPGDVIYIPPVGAQVALIGSVNEPAIYELKGEESISVVLQGTGGLTNLATAQRVLLERIENHTNRHVEEFALDAEGLQRTLKDGDLLRFFPLSPRFENAVTLRGNVAQPGRYVWHDGMKVSDLIPSRDTLLTRDYWNRQNHVFPSHAERPFGESNTRREERKDRIGSGAFEQDKFQQESMISENSDSAIDKSYGEYQNRKAGQARQSDSNSNDDTDENIEDNASTSGQYQRSLPDSDSEDSAFGNSRNSNLTSIAQNNAEINWEYAVIERLDDRDLSTHLIAFNLGNALDNHASSDNQLLKVGDVVTIFSRKDIPLPMDKHATFVRVGGEVNAPGVYRVNSGETLRNVVERAGGLTSHSYLYASQLFRVSTRRAQEEQLKLSRDRMQRDLLSAFANASKTGGDKASDQQAQLSMQQAMMDKLTSVKPTGRVVLAMKPDAASMGEIPDFPLEDGDSFYIPSRLSTVQVTGAVYNENAFRHQSGKPLAEYLNDAGGPTRDADTKRVFIIRADGTVVSRQSSGKGWHGNFSKLSLLPGDAIVVPEKLKVSSKLSEFLQVTQFMSQVALTAAALSVIQ